jgi:hypothetical protein
MTVPGNVNELLLAADAAGGGGYTISRSLRFNSADSAYLSRTPASAGNRKTWTWAGWVKRSSASGYQTLFAADPNVGYFDALTFGGETIYASFSNATNNGEAANLITSAVFRDFSAWMHIVFVVDTSNATSTERLRLYVNGSRITVFSTINYPAQNFDCVYFNTTAKHFISSSQRQPSWLLNGYLADIHFCDGTAYDPTSFGEFSATTGVWMPKAFTGSYGTNGFKLDFADNSAATAAALGKDTSGNGNNWTPTNLSVTAGAGNDSLIDVPVNGSQTDTGVGGEVRGNYCTWNALINGDTAANGNLDVTNDTARGTHKLLDYDAYWEIASAGGTTTAGIVSDGGTTNTTTIATGKTYGFKLSTAGALEYKNITDAGNWTSITTGLTGIQFPYASTGAGVTASLNAGQRAFASTAPSGFKALCTANLPAPTIVKPSTVMDVVLYTGTGSTLTPTSSLGFSPDLVWIKSRSAATDHALYNTVRGAQRRLESNTTDAEVSSDNGLTAFDSAGFTLGTLAQVNTNAATYAAWCWDTGSSTVSNTAGTITSSVRASTTNGCSVLTYISNGTNGATFGHGLGVAPQFIIIKSYTGGGIGWAVYHQALGNTKYLLLESTAAAATSSTVWNNTSPTSTVVTLGTNDLVNYSSGGFGLGYVAYCFAPVAGYSAFGSYTGNGSADGPFVYTGFRPRWLMIKNTIDPYDNGSLYQSHSWVIRDTARSASNAATVYLGANKADAEVDAWQVDILSNGFKVRTNTGSDINKSGNTMIYAAFAESPFQYSRAR